MLACYYYFQHTDLIRTILRTSALNFHHSDSMVDSKLFKGNQKSPLIQLNVQARRQKAKESSTLHKDDISIGNVATTYTETEKAERESGDCNVQHDTGAVDVDKRVQYDVENQSVTPFEKSIVYNNGHISFVEDFNFHELPIEVEASLNNNIAKFRSYSEVGLPVLQVMSFFGGIGMIFSSMLSFEERGEEGLEIDHALLSFYSWIFGLFIVVLEGKIFILDIKVLNRFISDYLKILRFLWGRGLLYAYAGSVHICLFSQYSVICGGYMSALGFISFALGMLLRRHLNHLRLEFKEKDAFALVFDFYDVDHDGFVDYEGFRDLVIGMGLSDTDDVAAFKAIDKDYDGLIHYSEVKQWFDDVIDTRNKSVQDGLDIIGLYGGK